MRRTYSQFAAALLLAAPTPIALAGDLEPPGPPGPTPGPEARIQVSNATTPGDSDSVYRIDTGGSYYLTGNVEGEVGKCGIEIDSSDVTLDLNGFSVIGVPGALDGIQIEGTRFSLSIHGGRVFVWPGAGIDAAGAVRSRFTDLDVLNNGGPGLIIGDRSLVERCIADANAHTGFDVGSHCLVIDCVAQVNTGDGMDMAERSTARGCTVDLNGDDGIIVNSRDRVIGCSMVGNAGAGVMIAGDGNLVERNQVSGNTEWGIDSILSASGNSLSENLVEGNGFGGIYLGDFSTDNHVVGNRITQNSGTGILDDSNNEIYGNTAIGNTTNYVGVDLVVTLPSTLTGPHANISR